MFQLKVLIISNCNLNKLTGGIPKFLHNLKELDVSGNDFSGEVPKQFFGGCHNLKVLKLSNNGFRGQIFSEYFNLTGLEYLHLDNNEFSGTLSDVITRSPLSLLDICNNYMSGEMPNWIRDILNFMSGLDLSCNNLTGEIPRELGNLSSLHALNLSHNELHGIIPKGFSNLSQIESLDLSYNRLSVVILVSITHEQSVVDSYLRHRVFSQIYIVSLIAPFIIYLSCLMLGIQNFYITIKIQYLIYNMCSSFYIGIRAF
ncbi:unnamed protein product, partial [Vitis vinifera]|uniref:Uncharacterized protein n=1 Tax=Vitis vinifera TaxID=29760 RepID=D7TSF9_VITVI